MSSRLALCQGSPVSPLRLHQFPTMGVGGVGIGGGAVPLTYFVCCPIVTITSLPSSATLTILTVTNAKLPPTFSARVSMRTLSPTRAMLR